MPKYALKGVPDIIVIKQGRFIGLEVKTKDGRLSADQVEFGRRAKEQGAEYCVVRQLRIFSAWGCRTMPRYRFPVYGETGTKIGDAEGVVFPDDRTALRYGMQIIASLKQDEPHSYIGWNMEIFEGERFVIRLPFHKAN